MQTEMVLPKTAVSNMASSAAVCEEGLAGPPTRFENVLRNGSKSL